MIRKMMHVMVSFSVDFYLAKSSVKILVVESQPNTQAKKNGVISHRRNLSIRVKIHLLGLVSTTKVKTELANVIGRNI